MWNALCDNYADAEPEEKMLARDLFGYWPPVSVRMFVNRQGGSPVGGSASAYIVGTRSGGEESGDADADLEDGDPDEEGGVAYLDPAFDDEDETIPPE